MSDNNQQEPSEKDRQKASQKDYEILGGKAKKGDFKDFQAAALNLAKYRYNDLMTGYLDDFVNEKDPVQALQTQIAQLLEEAGKGPSALDPKFKTNAEAQATLNQTAGSLKAALAAGDPTVIPLKDGDYDGLVTREAYQQIYNAAKTNPSINKNDKALEQATEKYIRVSDAQRELRDVQIGNEQGWGSIAQPINTPEQGIADIEAHLKSIGGVSALDPTGQHTEAQINKILADAAAAGNLITQAAQAQGRVITPNDLDANLKQQFTSLTAEGVSLPSPPLPTPLASMSQKGAVAGK